MMHIRIACPWLLVATLLLMPCLALAVQGQPALSSASAEQASPASPSVPNTQKPTHSSAQKLAKKPTKKKNTAAKEAPHASADHMGEALGTGASWYLDGTSRKARGAVWEHGVPMESLSRKQARRAAPSPQVIHQGKAHSAGQAPAGPSQRSSAGGVDTTKGIESALGEISSYERQPADGSAMGLNKPGVPSLQMTTEESSWRNPVTQPPTSGQEVMTTRRNVVGAYADVVKSDDLHVTMGPELHIPESDPTVKRLSPQQNDSSTLGFGMKWQWDF